MANYETLKSAIQQVVKQNGNNEITGALLQQSLLSMINTLGAGYQFMGVASPDTNPGTPDQRVFYITRYGNAQYTNFGIYVPTGVIGILKYGTKWELETVVLGKSAESYVLTIVVPDDNRNYSLLTKTGGLYVIAGDVYDTSPIYDVSGYRYLEYIDTWSAAGSPWVGVCLYNESNEVVVYKLGTGLIDLSQYPTAKYVRFCGSRRGVCEILLGNEVVDGHIVDNYPAQLQAITDEMLNFGYCYPAELTEINYNILLKETGEVYNLPDDIYDTSDYIDVKGADRVIFRNLFPIGEVWCGICFYDAKKNYLSTFNGGDGTEIVPTGTRYIRFCGARSANPVVVAYKSRTIGEIVAKNYIDIVSLKKRVSDLENSSGTFIMNYVYVGPNETYQTIQAAVAGITDNTKENRYTILLREGTYNISDAGINFIPIKPWVKIQGESRRVKVIFTSPTHIPYKNIFDVASGFDGYAEICNMSFETTKVKGTLHLDSPEWKGEVYMHDCDIYTYENEVPHDSSKDYFMYQAASFGSINTATHRKQTIRIENIVTNGYIYSHTELDGIQDVNDEPAKFIVKGCVCDWIGVYDNGSKTRKQAIIEDNKCNFIKIACGNVNNLDFMQWDVTLKNNNCKFVQGLYTPYNSQSVVNLWDNFYNNRMVFADSNLHRMVKNSTGAVIGRGTKVVFTDATQHEITIATGDTYDAITCQTINNGDYGIVQNGGDLAYYWGYIQTHPFEQS